MTPTPRTDAAEWEIKERGNTIPMEVVAASLARELERELNEARECCDKQAEMLSCQAKRNDELKKYLKDANRGAETNAKINQSFAGQINQLHREKAELLKALETLMNEYEDRKCQFGSDYLWEKHEDVDVISNARAAIDKANGTP